MNNTHSRNNNWYVITGAPHAGKTTLVTSLEKEGYRVVHETARVYIDQELAKGRKVKDIRKNELEFQKKVLQIKIGIEKKLPSQEIIFFDRGIPDTKAYYELHGFEIDSLLQNSLKQSSYKKVFLLEPIKYEKDYARIETGVQQNKLHQMLKKVYRDLEIPMMKVPKIKDEKESLKLIINNLQN